MSKWLTSDPLSIVLSYVKNEWRTWGVVSPGRRPLQRMLFPLKIWEPLLREEGLSHLMAVGPDWADVYSGEAFYRNPASVNSVTHTSYDALTCQAGKLVWCTPRASHVTSVMLTDFSMIVDSPLVIGDGATPLSTIMVTREGVFCGHARRPQVHLFSHSLSWQWTFAPPGEASYFVYSLLPDPVAGRLYLGMFDGVTVLDIASGERIERLVQPNTNNCIRYMSKTRNGHLLTLSSSRVFVWDLARRSLLGSRPHLIDYFANHVNVQGGPVHLDQQSDTLFICGRGQSVYGWTCEGLQTTHRYTYDLRWHSRVPLCRTIVTQGATLFIAYDNGVIYAINHHHKRLIQKIVPHHPTDLVAMAVLGQTIFLHVMRKETTYETLALHFSPHAEAHLRAMQPYFAGAKAR